MKSKDDMPTSFSAVSNNAFMISCGPPVKVKCIRCRDWCQHIALPRFTMYFCASSFCTNILELRHQADQTWELHDYGTAVQDLTQDAEGAQKLMVKPQEKVALKIVE
jgi:hypothetical protein